MRIASLAFLCVLCATSFSADASVRFPTEKDLRGIRITCGGGDVSLNEQVATQIVDDMKSDPSAKRNLASAQRSLAGIMEKITSSYYRNELYTKYLSCLNTFISASLVEKNETRAVGFAALGATYGAIRSGVGPAYTNDNEPIGLGRLGVRFNQYVATGLEGSYWQRRAEMVEAGKPFRTVATTATVPLYLHFGNRFPLMLYVGVGRGWESSDYMAPATGGMPPQRLSNRDAGRAWVAGAGFEYHVSKHYSINVLARGIRTRINYSAYVGGSGASAAERDSVSLGAALVLH